MDKFFIQNAFKTLDEIEAEMKTNKKTLKEAIDQSRPEALDIDELQDKYLGKKATVKDSKSTYYGEEVDIVKLTDFNSTFAASVWEVCCADGIKFNIEGKDLSFSLEEKLPRDLAYAYSNMVTMPEGKGSSRYNSSSPYHLTRGKGMTQNDADYNKRLYFPKAMNRKVTKDFENATYKDISAEDRKSIAKKYKDPGERNKLRLVISLDFALGDDYESNKYIPIMWDENNNIIVSPRNLLGKKNYDGKWFDTKADNDSYSIYSFNDLIEAAYKIYVTDEDEKLLTNTVADLRTPEEKEVVSLYNKLNDNRIMVNNLSWYDKAHDFYDKVVSSAISAQNLWGSNYANGPYYADTGRHPIRGHSTDQDLLNLQGNTDDYLKTKNRPSTGSDSDQKDREQSIKRALRWLKDSQYTYNRYRRQDKEKRGQSINTSLVKLALLKRLTTGIKEKFTQAYTDGIHSSSSSNDLYYHPYAQAMREKEELEQIIKKLNDEIAKKVAQIDKIKATELTTEAEEDFQEKLRDILGGYVNVYDETLEEYNKLADKIKAKVPVKESLDNCSLRIYTRDFDGMEDFIDDFNTEEEAKDLFKELVDSKKYEQVCLVSVCGEDTSIILNSDTYEEEPINETLEEKISDTRSIGEIVDDIIEKEDGKKLTESKSFNLKDSDEIVDAKAYKAIGQETDDKLVVVDPSIESLNDEAEPHVGDAILMCPSCKTTFFKPIENLVKDKDSDDLYNIDEPCPHCGAHDGFKYLYQVANKNTSQEVADNIPEDTTEDTANTAETNSEDLKDETELPDTLPESDTEYVDIDSDVNDVKEESFDRLVNPYLTKLYENIDSFKTTGIKQIGRNKFIFEGKLKSKNGNEKLVEFLFKLKESKRDSMLLEGYSKLFTKQKDAFKLKGNVQNKSLVFESFSYNYNKDIDGNQVLIEGIEK